MASSPLGSYSYGDHANSAHLHAATVVGSGSSQYTASYDAAGDMLCRAPSGGTTCASGSSTGQQLTWDAEGQLASWQNTPSSPTTTASYLYDGEGQRVAQQVTNTTSGTTTTTSYLGNLVEVTSDGTTTTTTDYLYAAGKLLAEAVNGTLTYLVTTHQGSVSEALDTNGTVTASQLYLPYGAVRYSSGAMPTSYGYTGQRSDAATSGLDYYGARYYDPTVGQFTSADTLLAGGLNRYGYVGGNPETLTDPNGHMVEDNPDDHFGAGVGEGGETTENLTDPNGANTPTISGSETVGLWIEDENGVLRFVDDNDIPTDGLQDANVGTISYLSDGEDVNNMRTMPKAQTTDDSPQPPQPPNPPTNPTQDPTTPNTPQTPQAPNEPNTPNSPNGDGNGNSGSGASSGTGSSSGAPNFVVTPNGETIVVPDGAQGPTPVINNDGLQTGDAFTNGRGGQGLSNRTTTVRIMYPKTYGRGTLQPGGYVVYTNEFGQKINPITGQTISNSDVWAHFPINLLP